MALTSTDKQVSSLIINKVPSEDVYQQMVAQNLVNDDEIYIVQDNDKTTIEPATATPKANGTASVGMSLKYAREDHVHPAQTAFITIPKGRIKGDIDGDGQITKYDLQLLQYRAIGSASDDPIVEWAGDINGDGSIDFSDTSRLNIYLDNLNKTYADQIFNNEGVQSEYYNNWIYHFNDFMYWTTEISVEGLNNSMNCSLSLSESPENNSIYKIELLENKIKIYSYMPPVKDIEGILYFTLGSGITVINQNTVSSSNIEILKYSKNLTIEDIEKACLGGSKELFLKYYDNNNSLWAILHLESYEFHNSGQDSSAKFFGTYGSSASPKAIQFICSRPANGNTVWTRKISDSFLIKPSMRKLTLSAANWSTSAKTYTATVDGILADATKQSIEINPVAKADNDNAVKFGVYPTAQGANSITFSCDTIPTTAINFYITYQDVNYLS